VRPQGCPGIRENLGVQITEGYEILEKRAPEALA